MDCKKLMSTDAGWGMFVLRIVTGIIFIGHGAPKFGWGSDRTLAGLAIAMLIAVTLVHLPDGMFGESGYQWALLLLACSLALMFEGAGKASLDKKLSS